MSDKVPEKMRATACYLLSGPDSGARTGVYQACHHRRVGASPGPVLEAHVCILIRLELRFS
jgi:hypothetical protein